MLPTIIIRHKKENLKKCSLKGLEKEEDFKFYTYPQDTLPCLKDYILLKMDGPVLTIQDSGKPLLLIDSTWKYLEKIIKILPQNIECRSLPKRFISAYPRRQTKCPDPKYGLASIEALYLAYLITNRPTDNLLNNYYWKDQFLKDNNVKKGAK